MAALHLKNTSVDIKGGPSFTAELTSEISKLPPRKRIEALQRRALEGIKLASSHHTGNEHVFAEQLLDSVLASVATFPAEVDLFSQLSMPTLYDATAANLISHAKGPGWLTRWNATSAGTELLGAIERGGKVFDDDAILKKINSACEWLLSQPFGFNALLHALLFRNGWLASACEMKRNCGRVLLRQQIKITAEQRRALAEFIRSDSRWDIAQSRFLWGSNRRFRRLVSGKSVAFVGPGKNDLQHGGEIDGFNLVVRTNPTDQAALLENGPYAGNRTDIAYYNGRMLKRRGDDVIDAMAGLGLKFACFRKRAHTKGATTVIGGPQTRVYTPDDRIFMGRGYALHHGLYDILRFSPLRVKVFNADFFLAPTTHYRGYLDSKLNLVHSYVVHDVFQSWHFMKAMLMQNRIEADDILHEILSLNERDFLARLQARIRALKSKELQFNN